MYVDLYNSVIRDTLCKQHSCLHQEIRQHLKSQRPMAGHTDASREGEKKTEASDSSHSHIGQETNTHTAEETKQSPVNEDNATKPSENVIQQSTDSPPARPQDSRRTSSPTVTTATFHAMTVSYKQTTPAIAMDTPPAHNMAAVAKRPAEPHYDMDAEPTATVTQATDAVAVVTSEGVREEAGVPYQGGFGVDLDEEECDCDMEEYAEDEMEPQDTYSR